MDICYWQLKSKHLTCYIRKHRIITIEGEVILTAISLGLIMIPAICLLLNITGFKNDRNKKILHERKNKLYLHLFYRKIFFKNWVEDTEKDWKHIIKVYLSANC